MKYRLFTQNSDYLLRIPIKLICKPLMAMMQQIDGFDTIKKKTQHPSTPHDLYACIHYLDSVPDARKQLDRCRTLSQEWDQVITHWSLLEASLLNEVGLDWKDHPQRPIEFTENLLKKVLENG